MSSCPKRLPWLQPDYTDDSPAALFRTRQAQSIGCDQFLQAENDHANLNANFHLGRVGAPLTLVFQLLVDTRCENGKSTHQVFVVRSGSISAFVRHQLLEESHSLLPLFKSKACPEIR